MQCMAQESSEASVAKSPLHPPSPVPASWWRDMHPYSTTPAWPPPPPATAATPRWAPLAQHRPRPSSSGADDDLPASNATMQQTSFTNTSTNHSAIGMDDSSAAAAADAESHLWNQVLMGAGGEVGRSMQVVHVAHDDDDDGGKNFVELLNSRTLAPELFAEPPACDYLKKMEYGGGSARPHVHQFNAANMDEHLASAADAGHVNKLAHHHGAPARLTADLSDLVSNWSIAPPDPCHGVSGSATSCDTAVSIGRGAKTFFLDSDGNVEHEMGGGGHGAMLQEAAGNSSTSSQDFTIPIGLGYSSMLGLSSNRMYGGGAGAGDVAMHVQWGRNDGDYATSVSDLISFGGEMPSASPAKTSSVEYKKQGREMSSPAVHVKTSSSGGCASGSSTASSEAKKKRSEAEKGSAGNVKKSKHEACSPTSSSLKGQVPKVKLGDKVTALQQIVSPFGKTDTASVLYEVINYINWLHEQVQLLSDPYMKSPSSKKYNPWGGLDRMEKAEAEADLKSRGLCLVPVSCTPELYRESNGPDYWTPPYRSCLYR